MSLFNTFVDIDSPPTFVEVPLSNELSYDDFEFIEVHQEELPLPDKLPVREFFNTHIRKTQEQCDEISQYPQRSLEWKKSRQLLLTGSNFGSALNTNPHCSSDELIERKLSIFKTTKPMLWGQKMEEQAEKDFLLYFQKQYPDAKILHFNLFIDPQVPYLGISTDGILVYTKEGTKTVELVEFKCPITLSVPYKGNIPDYYRDQVQGYLNLINISGIQIDGEKYFLQKGWFVTWQPTRLTVRQIDIDKDDWNKRIFPGLRSWYFTKFLPRLTL